MKKTERTGKAFYMKWLLLALFAAALIIMPAASQKVSAAKMVYTVKFNNNSGTSKSKNKSPNIRSTIISLSFLSSAQSLKRQVPVSGTDNR
mgnify:CR=1 FL=1